MCRVLFGVWIFCALCGSLPQAIGQIVINEGCNKNYSTLADEEGEFPDWIELYNAGSAPVNLAGYQLSDNADAEEAWILPAEVLSPGEFLVIYCSGKNRYASAPLTSVFNESGFVPNAGWNLHPFSTPFNWDGVSNLVLDVCSYSDVGYTVNSVHRQSGTPFLSTQVAVLDGSDGACWDPVGFPVGQRPNLRLNGHTIGTGTIANSPYDYPAPYGNWYWSARHQFLLRASELMAAGVSPGNLYSLAFDVVSTDPTEYTSLSVHLGAVYESELTGTFYPLDGFRHHTNFQIDGDGETVYLFSPAGVLLHSLELPGGALEDVSSGCFPDAATDIRQFYPPTPGFSNNASFPYTSQALRPIFSVEGGLYDSPFDLNISDPNSPPAAIYYTLDGSDPTESSALWTGAAITVFSTAIVRARAFVSGKLPSPISSSSYLLSVSHSTPILSVVTDPDNLYGSEGIFDNPAEDWLRAAHVEYFDTDKSRVFGQRAGISMDGGYGGSRWQPQRSFRVRLANGVLGDGPIDHLVIPDRPERTRYSDFYLRNGSNQYLVLPYKDACQVRQMAKGSNNYYSAWRPVTVYINGGYFGLYELREKMNTEFFEQRDGVDLSSLDLLSLSAFYGFRLRALEGSLSGFYADYAALSLLDPADTAFWTQADAYVDIPWYQDYIIAESWMGNVDWPYNNIKIYRSAATGNRWRYALIDLELALAPNSWTDCYFDHIAYLRGVDPGNPFTNLWLRGLQNNRFRDYFINRFADQMNSLIRSERLLELEDEMYTLTLPEMPRQFERWGNPFDILGQMAAYNAFHLIFRNELACRSEQVRAHIEGNFDLPGQVRVDLQVRPEGAGRIAISTLEPETYPWSGVYFDGLPVRLVARASAGFSFSHWEPNALLTDTLQPVFLDTLSVSDIRFTAVFKEEPNGITVQEESLPSLRIYPSPASQFIQVEGHWLSFTGELRWRIVDARGREVQHGIFSGAGPWQVSVEALAQGAYWIELRTTQGVPVTAQFIKG